jgi:UDP-2-acetamido-2-deoxy-ribo-hexuluronate aminotransferase
MSVGNALNPGQAPMNRASLAPDPRIEFVDLKAQYRALKADIDARIQRVLDHGQYIMGPEVVELETQLAAYTGAKFCISCASGTEALLMSLMALGIGPGDEVITSPFTFAATAEMIVLLGARPVFVDIEPDTCLIDAMLVEAKISARTKAIMPVSLYGQVCDMDLLNAIAARHGNIPVIEDAAQSFGASYFGAGAKRRKSCNLSTIGCTSFFPSKPLGCYGDGGALFTNDEALAKALREIRSHGQERRYFHTRVGVGGRMDTLQCAVLLAKLQRFDWEIQRRLALGEAYRRQILASDASVRLLALRPDRDCVWAQFTVLVEGRDAVQAQMSAAGVPTAVHYPMSLNQQPAYRHQCSAEDTPHSHAAARRVLSLPMSADLLPADQQRVVQALARAASLTQDRA